jgi:hypothetical protein
MIANAIITGMVALAPAVIIILSLAGCWSHFVPFAFVAFVAFVAGLLVGMLFGAA